MRFDELISLEAIETELKAHDKITAIQELASLAKLAYADLDSAEISQKVIAREQLGSTGIGNGVAIPHCKASSVKRLICCMAKSSAGVDFQAIDNKPVHLLFLIIAPENAAQTHLKALAKISKMCHKPEAREALIKAPDKDAIWKLLEQMETENR